MATENKRKNSNPYDNLAMIWEVLRQYATPQRPMTAKQVYQVLARTNEKPPDARTVSTLLEERQDMTGQLFGRTVVSREVAVVPSEVTVQKALRRHVLESTPINGNLSVDCVAKIAGKNSYENYDAYCDKKEDIAQDDLPDEAKPTRYYYLQSPLQEGEWQIFSDLVRFSPWISPQQTKRFLKVIKQFSAMDFPDEEVFYHFKRAHNTLFDCIRTLHLAIGQHQSVSLHYGTHVLQTDESGGLAPQLVERTKNGTMTLNPLSLLWANGLYYLVAQHEKYGTMHLRVDRILSVSILGDPFTPPPDFSAAKLRDRAPAMYGGVPTVIQFSCPVSMLNTVMDFFGSMAQYQQHGDTLNVTVQATKGGVKLFALQYLGTVEITDPPELRQEIAQALQQGLTQYKT